MPLLRRTSMLRTVFFVTANLAGFIAVSAFMHYLSVGQWLEFSLAGYRKALVKPLSDIMVTPLSIFTHPWMVVVTGLLVSAVVVVPVLVALLYRLRVAAVFVVAVAVVAHAPLLAAALAAGCFLTASSRLRSDLPYLAMLLGLAPAVVYLAISSFGTRYALTPLQQTAILLPYALALATALAAGAVVLALARLTKFRPGVIWPVLLAFLAAPIWLFYQKVGPGEFDYAVIVARIRSDSSVFVAESAPDIGHWTSPASAPASRAAATLAGRDIAPADTEEMLELCRHFLDRHAGHPRGAAIMWLRAASLEVQIRRRAAAAATTSAPAGGRGIAELQGLAWQELARSYPGSPQAMVAYQRLGIAALRDGRFLLALDHLRDAQAMLITHLESREAGAARSAWNGVFTPPETLPGYEYYRGVLDEADKIIWLMEINKAVEGSHRNRDAFQEYMRNWPFVFASRKELLARATGFQGTELADNFALRAVMAEENDLERARQLIPLAAEVNDAAIIANYELGRLGVRLQDDPAWKEMALKPADAYLKEVINARPNPYQASAQRHLQRLAGREEAEK